MKYASDDKQKQQLNTTETSTRNFVYQTDTTETNEHISTAELEQYNNCLLISRNTSREFCFFRLYRS